MIGFDDIDAAEMADLTTIRQHLDESGRLAVEILMSHIIDPSVTTAGEIAVNLVERQTT